MSLEIKCHENTDNIFDDQIDVNKLPLDIQYFHLKKPNCYL